MDSNSNEVPRKRMTRTEAKARTRELLLDAAAHTFARRGFAGASVEEIAEAAGFSIGAVYSNFGSKEQLFVELLSRRASGRIAEAAHILLDDAGGGAGDDPAGTLGRLLIATADEDVDFAPLQAEFWLYAIRNPEAMETLAARLREPRTALAEVITHTMADRGVTAAVPADVLATVVLALFQGLVQQHRTDPANVSDELFGQALGWLFSGVVGSAPGHEKDA